MRILYRVPCTSCSPLDIQAARFATRNPELTQAERQQRLAAQMPLADKCALADVVIDNGRGVRELREKVVEMVAMLRERERQRRSVKRRWFGVAMTVLVLAVGIGVRFMTMSGG